MSPTAPHGGHAGLAMWVITAFPADFPGKYVVRRHDVFPGVVRATAEHFLGDDLDEVRSKIPEGLHRMVRDPNDDPIIVEFWI